MPFKPGDIVICLETEKPNFGPSIPCKIILEDWPKEKETYTVRRMGVACIAGCDVGLVDVPDWTLIKGNSLVSSCSLCGEGNDSAQLICGWHPRKFRKLSSWGELTGKELKVPLPTNYEITRQALKDVLNKIPGNFFGP